MLRDVLQLLWHGAGRFVGRRFVGPFLGLGPERKRRADDCAVECAGATRPLGRPGERPRPGGAGDCRQYRGQLVIFWRQPTRRGPTLVRLYRRRALGLGTLLPEPTGDDRPGDNAAADLAEYGNVESRM